MKFQLALIATFVASVFAANVVDVRCPRSGVITAAQINNALRTARPRFFGNGAEGFPPRQPYPGAGNNLQEVNVNNIVRAVFSLNGQGRQVYRGTHEHPPGLSNGAIRCTNVPAARATPTPTPANTPAPAANTPRPASPANNPAPPANPAPASAPAPAPAPAQPAPAPATPARPPRRGGRRGGRGKRSASEMEL